jgi:oxygen-independent coproporphyrinogen-3 oxidase
MEAVALAAKTFPRYSFDLIYARPKQTPQAWEKELKEALKHADGHLSLYQLTIEENTAFHHAHAKGAFKIPEDEGAAELYELTQDIMQAVGMPAYEISNHAKPGQESKHNLAYWLGHEYAGIGPGAHGRIGNRIATQAIKSPERWLEAVNRQGHGYEVWQDVSEEEARQEKLMMRLRLSDGFARADMPFLEEKNISRLMQHGLLEENETAIRPTPRGKLLLNYLTAELLA